MSADPRVAVVAEALDFLWGTDDLIPSWDEHAKVAVAALDAYDETTGGDLEAERDEALRHVEALRERCDVLGRRDTGSDCITVPPCAAVTERDEARAAIARVRALCDEAERWALSSPSVSTSRIRAALDGGGAA